MVRLATFSLIPIVIWLNSSLVYGIPRPVVRHKAERRVAIPTAPLPAPTEPQEPSVKSNGVPILISPPSRRPKSNLLLVPPVKKSAKACKRPKTTTKPACAATRTAAPKSTATTHASTSDSDPIMAAYYPDWGASSLPPEKVDFNRLDWVDFAFALPNKDFGLYFTQDDSESILKKLVKAAHAKGKKVKLSIGGWTGSKYFSPAVSTEENRKTFAQSFLDIYDKFGLDGIDIDWEYPGTQGDSGNIVSSDDSANYLKFLKLLRSTLPSDAVITAATQVWPFAGPDGRPLKDVSEFAKYFDWILLMNYDIWGSSSTPGPNAPMDNGCKNSTQPLANAVAAVKSWTDAGFPAEKITLGVPSYGYISKSRSSRLSGRDDGSVEVKNDNGGTSNGQVQFTGLISQGALYKGDDGSYTGSGGFTRHWDSCSSTPWLKSTSSGQIVTYDDPESLRMKAEFAKKAGIKGINMFDAHGDTDSWELVDALRDGLGLN